MSAEQRVTYKSGEKQVHINQKPAVNSSPVEGIEQLSSPEPSSDATRPPSTPVSSWGDEKTDCGLIRKWIASYNKWLTSPLNGEPEDEVVKDELKGLTSILVRVGYIFGIGGLVACICLYIFIERSDPNSKMAAWTISVEFPVIFLSIIWCSVVSHCRPRGSYSSVPEYAPQKRGPNSGIEDDGEDYPLVKCATGTSSEESIEKMLNIGMPIENILAAGKTILEMRTAGVSVKMMYDAGVSVKMMYDEGVPVEIMRDAGISSNVLIEGGVPVEEDFGVAASETVTSAELSVCQGSGGTSLQEPYFALPM